MEKQYKKSTGEQQKDRLETECHIACVSIKAQQAGLLRLYRSLQPQQSHIKLIKDRWRRCIVIQLHLLPTGWNILLSPHACYILVGFIQSLVITWWVGLSIRFVNKDKSSDSSRPQLIPLSNSWVTNIFFTTTDIMNFSKTKLYGFYSASSVGDNETWEAGVSATV